MSLNKFIPTYIKEIVSKLQDSGFEAYLVGGAVRDLLINRSPKDFDISTDATPKKIQKSFPNKRTIIIGRRFKIVHLYYKNNIFEISTFRREPKPNKSGNNPTIKRDNVYGHAQDDVWRRDFTINAIFYNPINDKIIDYTNLGVADLRSGIVRCIGDTETRFIEDPVRVLRGLKLLGQYEFSLEPKTEQALRASLSNIVYTPKARLKLEFEKIIKKPYSVNILSVFYNYGFLYYFLPFLHYHWNSKELKISFQLLRKYNSYLEKNTLNGFLSVGVSLLIIPFVNEFFTENPKDFNWTTYPGIENDIRKILKETCYPFIFSKFINLVICDVIILQQNFKNKKRINKTKKHPRYLEAREAAFVLNEMYWNDPKFQQRWYSGKAKRRSKKSSA